MTPEQRAWVAGLLEGEGCFKLNRGKYVYIECNMGDEDVIRKLHEFTGVGTVTGPYSNPKKPEWTPMWRFGVHRQADAIPLIKDLLPHMGARRTSKILELFEAAGVEQVWP